MREAVRSGQELCRRLELPPEYGERADQMAGAFGLFVPEPFLAKMRPGDLTDPLLRQVLPVEEEWADVPGFSADPVGDEEATIEPGLLRKYAGRALLIVTGACAVHCRYCFRRHFPYPEAPKGIAAWGPAIEALRDDPTIHEVLLSGGDPLMLGDGQLGALIEELARVPHLRRLRVHTRLPIVVPQRVTAELLEVLRGSRLTPIVVVHVNHPRELGDDVAGALARLIDAGVPVLNQAVLLRGINDDADVLAELCERLVDQRVIPYYLHQLDRVRGAAHFEVPHATGRRIIEELRARLPGYAVPRYVEETAGAKYKRPLD